MEVLPNPRRPLVMVITAGFLAHAGLIPLMMMQLSNAPVSVFSKLLLALTLVACAALLLPGRQRWAFHLARAALACWVLSALIALHPARLASVSTASPPGTVATLIVAAMLMSTLFYFFGFGQACRAYYGFQRRPDLAP